MNDHEATRDVREATRCPLISYGTKCHMTVGHAGSHAGVTSHGNLIAWSGWTEPMTVAQRPCDYDDCPYVATGFDAWGYWCDEHDGGLE
jgi:hypothetical protein